MTPWSRNEAGKAEEIWIGISRQSELNAISGPSVPSGVHYIYENLKFYSNFSTKVENHSLRSGRKKPIFSFRETWVWKSGGDYTIGFSGSFELICRTGFDIFKTQKSPIIETFRLRVWMNASSLLLWRKMRLTAHIHQNLVHYAISWLWAFRCQE